MKKITIAVVAAIAVVLSACSTNNTDVGLNCETATKAYTMYLASLQVREPSKDEVKAASLAAAYLSAFCGWKPAESAPTPAAGPVQAIAPKSKAAAPNPSAPVDRFNVPVLTPQ